MASRKTTYEPQITRQTMLVLNAFIADPLVELSGSDLLNTTPLASGTLYPILMRLEEAKWLKSRQEDVNPSDVKRPRRRLYRITSTGLQRTRAIRTEIFGGLPA